MSLGRVEADCPGCEGRISFDVNVPDPQISVIEDTTIIEALTKERDTLSKEREVLYNERDTLMRRAEATAEELAAWQTMERHAPVPQILEHLGRCPNCRPQLESFLDRYVKTQPAERVKELARQQKWWPPPPLEIVTKRR